jgi:hypothetical protein
LREGVLLTNTAAPRNKRFLCPAGRNVILILLMAVASVNADVVIVESRLPDGNLTAYPPYFDGGFSGNSTGKSTVGGLGDRPSNPS